MGHLCGGVCVCFTVGCNETYANWIKARYTAENPTTHMTAYSKQSIIHFKTSDYQDWEVLYWSMVKNVVINRRNDSDTSKLWHNTYT